MVYPLLTVVYPPPGRCALRLAATTQDVSRNRTASSASFGSYNGASHVADADDKAKATQELARLPAIAERLAQLDARYARMRCAEYARDDSCVKHTRARAPFLNVGVS